MINLFGWFVFIGKMYDSESLKAKSVVVFCAYSTMTLFA